MARFSPTSMKRDAAVWLRQGISPQRLALTLALGFAIGCIPVLGIPTVLCAALAMSLRLNMPAIQAANYLAMPLQLFLIVPFVRLGGWLLASGPQQSLTAGPLLRISSSECRHPAGQHHRPRAAGLGACGRPRVALMTLMLTGMLRRIPALAEAENGD